MTHYEKWEVAAKAARTEAEVEEVIRQMVEEGGYGSVAARANVDLWRGGEGDLLPTTRGSA